MLNAGVLTFQEFAMGEPLPLATLPPYWISYVSVMMWCCLGPAFHQRRGKPKSGTDWRDIAMLLLAFPDLKVDPAQSPSS
jgi:hypothetical protein